MYIQRKKCLKWIIRYIYRVFTHYILNLPSFNFGTVHSQYRTFQYAFVQLTWLYNGSKDQSKTLAMQLLNFIINFLRFFRVREMYYFIVYMTIGHEVVVIKNTFMLLTWRHCHLANKQKTECSYVRSIKHSLRIRG
jgi:hypothetical protein